MSFSKILNHAINFNFNPKLSLIVRRSFTQNNTRSALQTGLKRKSLKEIIFAPGGEGAFILGKGAVAGGSALGLAALCYYGLGMSKDIGALDKSIYWPQIVKDRIRNTYLYFGGSLMFTAGSAFYMAKNQKLMNLLMKSPWMTFGITFVAIIATGALCRSIPYTDTNLLAKHATWILHNLTLGSVIAPMTLLGGPIMLRAAIYTAGIIGSLSLIAACAPSEKFLNMNGPLAIGLGTVFAASLGGMFLPATTALGAGLYSISLYGGLILFSLFLLYDTQKIVKVAETYPKTQMKPFDPINASMGIYMDTLNIFIRMVMIFAHGGGSKRR